MRKILNRSHLVLSAIFLLFSFGHSAGAAVESGSSAESKTATSAAPDKAASVAAAAPGSPGAPYVVPPRSNPCLDITHALDQAYQTLYNVDTRPLAIDSYRSYRDAIQILHDQTSLLTPLCSAPSAPVSSSQVLYKTRNIEWTSSYSYTNQCTTADFAQVRTEFEETSIRECYRDGYAECAIKKASRQFNVSGTMNSDNTWKCVATLDMLIDAKK